MNKKEIACIFDQFILGEENREETNELNIYTDLINDYSYDSLSIMQLVVSVEEAFDIRIDDDALELENLRSYSWWIEYIFEKVNL